MITREEAIAQMQEDIILGNKNSPGWSDRVIWSFQGVDYTPSQLVAEVQIVPETDVAKNFLAMYIDNLDMEHQIMTTLGINEAQLAALMSGLIFNDGEEPESDEEPTLH